MAVMYETDSSASFGRGTEEVAGIDSESSAGALVFFFGGSFFAPPFVVEGEGSVTDEGGRPVEVDACAECILWVKHIVKTRDPNMPV